MTNARMSLHWLPKYYLPFLLTPTIMLMKTTLRIIYLSLIHI